MSDKPQPQSQMPEETVDVTEPHDVPNVFAIAEDAGMETLIRERDEWRDKAYRAAAEMENVRKRAAAEVNDSRQFAVSKFAQDMLGVGDNLARALTAPEGNEKALREGIAMTATQLQTTLSRHGIAIIAVKAGDALNPELHQAVSEVPTNDVPAGAVVQEIQAGFTINGRLLRPSMVVVAKAVEA
ncbi:MAG: nucleotide exchange factor GrpE [Alphaproteobacteria bacterium]|nr:MAG: nucleotide exchange factor GrpE [Alphaproteobacteria bacterium]